MLLGLLSSAAGLAAAELVVGLVRGSASPVVPVGQEVIDRVSPSVKDWAIDTFGTADKAVLVLGSLIVLAVIGSIVGILTVRGHRTEAYIVTLFTGLIGVLAVLQRPAPSFGKLAPALVGTAVSIATLWWLSERLVSLRGMPAGRAGDQTSTAPASSEPAQSETMGLNRRGFLYGAVTVGSASVVTAGFGRMLQRRFDIDDERAEFALPEPSSSSPAVGAPSTAAGEFDFGIDGISPFVTPVEDFYRIDTAIVVPQVSKDSWSLKIGGMVDHELELTFDDLLAREQVERYVTLSCVSNEVGGDLVGNGVWQGVMLADVLGKPGSKRAPSSWSAARSTAGRAAPRSPRSWTAATRCSPIGQNGQPLRAEHGYPVRMVVPGLYGYVSATKWVTEIELTTWDEFDAYWVPRGWAKEAPVKTMTRIDRPRAQQRRRGRQSTRSVAWPGRCTGGSRPCRSASTAASGSMPNWPACRATTRGGSGGTRWDADPGEHIIEARAIDGAGAIQDEEPRARPPTAPRATTRSTSTSAELPQPRFVSPRSASDRRIR